MIYSKKFNGIIYKEFVSPEAAKDFQDKVYGSYCEKYKENRKRFSSYHLQYRNPVMDSFIEQYLGYTGEDINNYLRSGHHIFREFEPLFDSVIDRLNEFIISAPTTPENIVVYRGVSDKVLKIMKTDEHKIYRRYAVRFYVEKGFLSTSLTLDAVMERNHTSDNILKIYVPSGAIALGVDNIAQRGESELLFPPEQRLEYISKYYDEKIKKNVYEYRLWLEHCA